MSGEGSGGGSDWGMGGSRDMKPENPAKDPVPEAGAAEGTIICVCYQCGFRVPLDPECSCRKNVCPRCGGDMGRE